MKESQSSSDPVLALSGIRKTVAGTTPLTILEHVDLNVVAGESLAILGRSGSGKTTLLSIMAGLDIPSTGDVMLQGSQLSSLDENGRASVRRTSVCFVFQNFQLHPYLSALENVMLPLDLKSKYGELDSTAKNSAQEAESWLQQVGLGERINAWPTQLSGGEQQRVALARAFAGRPKILFADEPTGNLDEATGGEIIDLLFELNHKQATTLILVTHDIKLAERCHRRVYLYDGRLHDEPASVA
ncbi:ABC transporter ATP-binding protein [Allohahella marinimesophila]|uniref:ABC transporter ATP-binding protein n=1 Tax=Allohahella marinimesophila TaxID=1054972 RepID=A0ABP7NP64_9GAMM